jgi:polysaccharide deacetylase 2 family uncharacterized protein YibQ
LQASESVIGIIIDDLGNRGADRRAVYLPGAVTLSFLPHTPYGARLAQEAHGAGKEVMLHLPMDSIHGRPLGPGGLTTGMNSDVFLGTLRRDLEAIPFISGVNNHMGSLLTADPARMGWLMSEIRARKGLFFVDSRTSRSTVAAPLAVKYGIASTSRDIFLDNDRRAFAVTRQFEELIAKAQRTGAAIGIGHPHPETMAVLEAVLPQLAERGVHLVPVSKVIQIRQQLRPQLWQASLFPSPKAAKNLKP